MEETERLAAFLFRVARDDVPFGRLEGQLQVVEESHPDGSGYAQYLGPAEPMGEWARDTAARLVGPVNRSACDMLAKVRAIIERPYSHDDTARSDEERANRLGDIVQVLTRRDGQ